MGPLDPHACGLNVELMSEWLLFAIWCGVSLFLVGNQDMTCGTNGLLKCHK